MGYSSMKRRGALQCRPRVESAVDVLPICLVFYVLWALEEMWDDNLHILFPFITNVKKETFKDDNMSELSCSTNGTETKQWVMGCHWKPMISGCFSLNGTHPPNSSRDVTVVTSYSDSFMPLPWTYTLLSTHKTIIKCHVKNSCNQHKLFSAAISTLYF